MQLSVEGAWNLRLAIEYYRKCRQCKGQKRFGVRGKLSPRCIGSYEILARVRAVAYRLALPPKFEGIHNVFYVSNLRKDVYHLGHILELESVDPQENMIYEVYPVCILDCEIIRIKKELDKTLNQGGCEGEAEVLKFLHCAEFQHRLLAIGIGKENLVKLRIGGCKGEVGVQNFSISTLLLELKESVLELRIEWLHKDEVKC
uniref:Tf2-1-like SH3-like domain-containing protein n=1 Tax=Ananas comosus var. bracteatus TaxID=296719 RepID=A0A6V7NWR2_ANACO|nr:unnamed protein product [Ananas comosus var. bracteatus]